MRISELSRTTGVPVATIKFYLREHLLHEGALTSQTQAQYDNGHARRLHLVRALLGPGGLSVAATRDLLQQMAEPTEAPHQLLGVAHKALQRSAPADAHLGPARELLQRWGWRVDPADHDATAALAGALQGLSDAGFTPPEGALDHYAGSMRAIAEFEIAGIPTDSVDEAIRYVVLGTVLIEPVLLALRRLAQQDASGRRFD